MSTTYKRLHILLGVTGSVAAVKAPEIALELSEKLNANVKVVLTRGGVNFWNCARDYNPMVMDQFDTALGEQHSDGSSKIQIHYSEEEWRSWKQLGDSIMHIDLREWADILVIAPLSAHTLAKVATGLCDDVLSSVVRAWDYGHGTRPGKPIVLAPAMNTAMWQHPLTQQQLNTIRSFWKIDMCKQNEIRVVAPQVKELACGEVGDGALASVRDIVQEVETVLQRLSNLSACYSLTTQSLNRFNQNNKQPK